MKINYFIWGGDQEILMPHNPDPSININKELIFSGFIREGNENYRFANREPFIENGTVFLSLKNFLRQARLNNSILVLYFRGKWFNNYLYNDLKKLEDNKKFKIKVMDILEFSITYGFTNIYESLSLQKKIISEHKKEYKNLIGKMTDDFSKLSLNAYLEAHLDNSMMPLNNYIMPGFRYFNSYSTRFSFVPSDEEIYVDVGAFDGETVFDFINSTPTGKYKAIHAFEPNPDFFPVLKEKSQYIPNLYCYPLAASNTQGSISFFKQKSGSRPIENTQEYKNDQIIEVKTCKLDDVIEKATLMKVEVEGHEVSVIEGASSIIKKNKPNLTVETYHFANDALKVFDSVMSIHKYKYIGWRMTGFFTNTIFFSDTQKLS